MCGIGEGNIEKAYFFEVGVGHNGGLWWGLGEKSWVEGLT